MTAAASGAASAADARRAQVAQGLTTVRRRIAAACAAADRDPTAITLIVVTKFFPARDVRLLADLGVRDVGENRDQEAAAKLAELAQSDPAIRATLRTHFIGQLQTNKAASVATYADVVHSVDRDRLVAALAKGADRAERRLDVLVQVSLDGSRGRGGVPPDEVPALADLVAAAAPLRLRGVMAVAPLDADPDEAFARLAEISRALRADHPDAGAISAGMSGDLEAAVRHGATHLRVGSAILGSRPRTG